MSEERDRIMRTYPAVLVRDLGLNSIVIADKRLANDPTLTIAQRIHRSQFNAPQGDTRTVWFEETISQANAVYP